MKHEREWTVFCNAERNSVFTTSFPPQICAFMAKPEIVDPNYKMESKLGNKKCSYTGFD